MAELTTDQRLAAQIGMDMLPKFAHDAQMYENNTQAVAPSALSGVYGQVRMNVDAQGERLTEIVEALAAGTLRIVDEYALVRTLQRVIDGEREAADDPKTKDSLLSPLRVAQLAFVELVKSEAIR